MNHLNGSTRGLAKSIGGTYGKQIREIEAALDAIEAGDFGPPPWRIGSAEVMAGFFALPESNAQTGVVRTDRDPGIFRCLPIVSSATED